MTDGFHVGLALSRLDERTRAAEWLVAAGHTVESLVDACRVDSDIAGRGFGCVLADGEVLEGGFMARVRRQDARLPLVAVVEADTALSAALGSDVGLLSRPLDGPAMTLAVALAFGESRQTRKRIRRRAPRLSSRAAGAPAEILDVSADGLRLELSSTQVARLGPYFRLQVSMVALDVVVKRVWVGRAAGARVQCGAILVGPDDAQRLAWDRLLEIAATTASIVPVVRAAPGAVTGESRLLGRVTQLLASTPIVSGLTGAWTRGRS
jgi:hypothetical protein